MNTMIPLREDDPVYSKEVRIFNLGSIIAAKANRGTLYVTCGSALAVLNDLAAITVLRAYMSTGVSMLAVDQHRDNLMLMPLDLFVQLLLEDTFKEMPFDDDQIDNITNIFGYGIRSLVEAHFKVAPKLPTFTK